jgi:hypothetical protein
MRRSSAFPAKGHILDFVAVVNAKVALHVAMTGCPAFRFAQSATTIYANTFVNIAVRRRTALRRFLDDAATFRTTIVEHSTMRVGSTRNGIHGLATLDA